MNTTGTAFATPLSVSACTRPLPTTSSSCSVRRSIHIRAPVRRTTFMTTTPPSSSDDNDDTVSPPPPPPPPVTRTPGKKLGVTNSPPSTKKLTRNKPGMEGMAPVQPSVYADATPGDMVGAPEVGEGMGPRRGVAEKKVTRAAAIQKSRTFADAWAEQNEGKIDVWIIIGAVTLLTPIIILVWAVATGVIPTGGLFED